MELLNIKLIIGITMMLLFCLTLGSNRVLCSDGQEEQEVSIEHRSSPDHKELLVLKADSKTCAKSSSLACSTCCVMKGYSMNKNSFKGELNCVCDVYAFV